MTGRVAPDGHFRQGGDAYAQYRPTYPSEIASKLRDLAPSGGLVIDVGCGSGQLSSLLADRFDRVIACDISADQIAHATARAEVSYHVAPAHQIPVTDHSADLVTVAQAAHWFDLDLFYPEVRRVARPGAVLALISYGVMQIEGPLVDRFHRFYWKDIHRYWPPERCHVENGYADLDFPFRALDAPEVQIVRDWDLDALLGYIETWSAVKAARRAKAGAIMRDFRDEAAQIWGDPTRTYRVTWQISIRLASL